MAWRSTRLKLLEAHCPRALDFEEAGAPYDREVFQVGIAAHAVIETIGKAMNAGGDVDPAAIADGVVRELVTRGRSFEGIAEPPMPVAAASAGRDVALAYLSTHELSPTAHYEHGLAVDADWRPVDYDSPRAWYRAAIDTFEVIEDSDDDGYTTTVLVTTDWKTAWPTDATELDTVQLRGQAAVALAHYPDATVVRRRVVNLRTGQAYEVDVVLDDEGHAKVNGWRRDIGHAIAAAETRGADGKRPARAGAGCLGCPYLIRCEAARLHMRGTFLDGTAEQIATRLAVADAVYDEMFAACKALAAEGPVEIAGGHVGFTAVDGREALPDAGITLAHQWFGVSDTTTWDAENGQLVGLLAVMEPGITTIETVAKAMHPALRGDKARTWAARREAAIAACVTPVRKSKFGIHRTPAEAAAPAPANTEATEAAAK